jgi:hypothetical protein
MESALGWAGGVRIWGKALLTALGAGALFGAGQLGVAYGLGVVRLDRSFEANSANQWNAQLAWVAWFAMLAAIAGAAVAARAASRHGRRPGAGTRIVLALFSGVGAGVVVPLAAQPARSAKLSESVDPALVVGLAAGIGAVAGLLIAVAVLSLRPLAWNVAAVGTVVWLAGLVAVGPYLRTGDPVASVRLGVPQWTVHTGDGSRLADTLAMPVLAWLIAVLVALVARGRREPSLGIAANGLAGAALLALAYLIAGPGRGGEPVDQTAPYLGALFAVASGLLGSLLVALIPRRSEQPAPKATEATEASPRARSGRPLEPSNIIPPVAPAPRQRNASAPPEWPVAPTATIPRATARVPSGQWPDPFGAPTASRESGATLPRRTPGERFPAGA